MSSSDIKRVGIIFSGGPAPGANAVIAAAATSFMEEGREVIGFFHGYSALQEYDPVKSPIIEGEHYLVFTEQSLRGLRNQRGIVIGTARANPGKGITEPDDLQNPEKTVLLQRVYRAMVDLGIDALISIGGDDTLKTANFFHAYQQSLPPAEKRVRVIHLPKTIDNDYHGIDFTFGFFTAVDFMAKELMNLRADALSTGSYYIVEAMGRKAGWLSYGVAIAGEAHLVVSVEDVDASLCLDEPADNSRGTIPPDAKKLSLDALCDRIVNVMLAREERKKFYGTIVLAEGLAEMLSGPVTDGVPRDEHGHLALGKVSLGKWVAEHTAQLYAERTGRKKKITGVQMGYEARCAPPHAFDVMLGSQLGIGAYRGLVEQGLDGHMVSVTGQLDLKYVPFSELINEKTLLTEVRFIQPESDFHRLARSLETRVEPPDWIQGPRSEG